MLASIVLTFTSTGGPYSFSDSLRAVSEGDEGERNEVRLSPPPKKVAKVDLLGFLAAFVSEDERERAISFGLGGVGIVKELVMKHLCVGNSVSKPTWFVMGVKLFSKALSVVKL